eukprot:489316_1
MSNTYCLRSKDELNHNENSSAKSTEEPNLQYNSSLQFYLDVKDEEWRKLFKFQDKQIPSYIFFPEIFDDDDRVYLHLSTARKPTNKTTSWLLCMKYVITTNSDVFTAIYDFFRNISNMDDINEYYSNTYLNKIIDVFNSTRIQINKDIPIGAFCVFVQAERELKENYCDVIIVEKITNREMNFSPLIDQTGVYKGKNVKIDFNASSYLQPPTELQRYKWFSGKELKPLLSPEQMSINNSYYRNVAVYFGNQSIALGKQLNNYKVFDKLCCGQVLSAIAIELIALLNNEHSVGKTKRIGFIVPLMIGKFAMKRYLRNEIGILLDQWKKTGTIYTLLCDEIRHSELFGAEATTREVITSDEFGQSTKAFDICFQWTKFKIGEIDEFRSRIYVWSHVIKIMPNGNIVGFKEKQQRKRNHNENDEENKEEEEENKEDEAYDDPVMALQSIN